MLLPSSKGQTETYIHNLPIVEGNNRDQVDKPGSMVLREQPE